MADKKKIYKCTRCDVEFSPPKWQCEDGRQHEVEAKTYYAAAGSLITYAAEERLVDMEDGRKRLLPARRVQFNRGAFTTCDPEEQYGLDANRGLITVEEWRERFLSTEDRMNLDKQKLQAENNRLVQEHNELLAQIQASKAKVPARASV